VGAKELVARKGNLYGEAIVLDTRGEKLGRSRSTRAVRISPSAADPQWDALLALYAPLPPHSSPALPHRTHAPPHTHTHAAHTTRTHRTHHRTRVA
jgi:hypothetical protein